jgi:hypothetical protein
MIMSLFRTAILVLILTSFLGIACAYYPYNTPVPDNQDLIFEVFSVAGVNCANPPVPSTFTISEERTIVMIATYHWCDGENPGTISLQRQDGTIYGPWQAIGRDGSGGASNRYWEVGFADGLNLPPGTYTIIDSRPGTWSWTEDVGNRGHSYVFAQKEKTDGSAQPCSNYWGPIEPTGTEAAGPWQSPGKYMLVYAEVAKSSDTSQSLPANWNWKNFGPVDLNGGMRYFLVFGRSADPELFEEQNLPTEETLVTATKDTAIIWDANKATSDVQYAYCLQPAPQPSDPPELTGIVGTWSWFTGETVEIRPDRTFSSEKNKGIWEHTDQSGRLYSMRWDEGGWIDSITLSSDGKSLTGQNQYGTSVTATKV